MARQATMAMGNEGKRPRRGSRQVALFSSDLYQSHLHAAQGRAAAKFVLRFAFGIGNKTDVLCSLWLSLWGKFLLCPPPLLPLSPPFVLHCFECAKASRGSAPLGGGFGKCEEKWARLLVRRNETGPGRLVRRWGTDRGTNLVSELTLTGQRTILDDCDCSRPRR